jgi:hypothetical protein
LVGFLAEALDRGEDLVGGLGPAEGLWIVAVALDEAVDFGFKLNGGLMGAALKLLPCPITGMILRQWLEECLIPERQSGNIIVIDTLPVHKVAGIRQPFEYTGMHLLYLFALQPRLRPS